MESIVFKPVFLIFNVPVEFLVLPVWLVLTCLHEGASVGPTDRDFLVSLGFAILFVGSGDSASET